MKRKISILLSLVLLLAFLLPLTAYADNNNIIGLHLALLKSDQ